MAKDTRGHFDFQWQMTEIDVMPDGSEVEVSVTERVREISSAAPASSSTTSAGPSVLDEVTAEGHHIASEVSHAASEAGHAVGAAAARLETGISNAASEMRHTAGLTAARIEVDASNFASSVKDFLRRRYKDLRYVAQKALDFSANLVTTIFDLVARMDYLGTKLGAILEGLTLIADLILYGAVLPLSAAGAVLLGLHKLTGWGGNLAQSAFKIARAITENNITISAIGLLATQTLTFFEAFSIRKALSVATSFIPSVTGTLIATAATIWHDKVNYGIRLLGAKLGLNAEPAQVTPASVEVAHDRIAQFVGSGVALAAATVTVPVTTATLIGGSVISAVGAASAKQALHQWRNRAASNAAAAPEPQVAAPAAASASSAPSVLRP